MKKWMWMAGVLVFLLFAGDTMEVCAAVEMTEELDFSELDSFLEENGVEELSFSGLVEELMQDGIGMESFRKIADVIVSFFFLEIEKNHKLLLEIVMLAAVFSILKNFTGAFQSAYVSEMCFLLIYCVLALMLLRSMQTLQEIVTQTVTQSVDFMKMLVPAFCASMIFSSNLSASAGFYQAAFLVIYLVEWGFLNILLPLIHIYVLFVLFNHFMEEERFGNLTELFRELVCKGVKLAGVAVFGLNVVQNLISPAKDRIAQGTLGRAVSLIPGVGNAMSGAGEILLGTGIVVKNCVGVAGVVVLLVIGLIPLLKIACLTFFYRVAAAATEPVTDKRISGCLKGMAEGAVLYAKLLGYCLLLFFITIGLTVAATSFMY